MSDLGWTKVYRSIKNNWIWEDKPFSRGQAFIDLVLSVNHQDKKIIFNGTLVEVKRGSCITSIRKLGEQWGWSNKKVKKFLEQLQQDQMLSFKSNTKRTLVTIENYSLYQSKETPKEHQSTTEEKQKHNKSISKAYQKHTNKNDKECIKNDKEREEGKEVPTLPPLSFPSEAHKKIYEELGEVSYRTWFLETEIEEGEIINIKTSYAFKKDVIKERYLSNLKLMFQKEVEVIN